jgi:hypothetical protein
MMIAVRQIATTQAAIATLGLGPRGASLCLTMSFW